MKKLLGIIVLVVISFANRGVFADDSSFYDTSLSLNLTDGVILAAADATEEIPPVQDGGGDTQIVGDTVSTTGLLASNHEGYVGGRGLITLEGVSGMFLNPTSGTLGKGQFVAQYCAGVLRQNSDYEIQHTAMFAYGVTDWLEVGGFFRVSELDNDHQDVGAGGPLIRIRLLKEDGWIPEVSVGGMSRNGFEALTKHTIFVAASKRFVIDEDGFLKSVRTHVGFRQIWQDSDVNEANGSIIYTGIDVEVPFDIYIVSEVSNKDDVFNHTPFSIGLQWRPTRVIGLSIAGVQSGGEDNLSLFAGIGITLEF